MAQKLRKHGKKLEKTSVGCDIDFTILLSMLKVNQNIVGDLYTTLLLTKQLRTILKNGDILSIGRHCHRN